MDDSTKMSEWVGKVMCDFNNSRLQTSLNIFSLRVEYRRLRCHPAAAAITPPLPPLTTTTTMQFWFDLPARLHSAGGWYVSHTGRDWISVTAGWGYHQQQYQH